MKGKFKGRSSMGFQNGVIYNIRSDIQKIRKGVTPFYEDMMCICIYDMNSNAWCPYNNLEAVLKNWELISI